VTRHPPIRVARRPSSPGRHGNTGLLFFVSESTSSSYSAKQYCMRLFTEWFGYMPLIRSSVRFEPLLHRDPVSVFRKKYRQMETGMP